MLAEASSAVVHRRRPRLRDRHPAGLHLVYHRKLGSDYGWADREIRWAPFVWDVDGYPVVQPRGPVLVASAPVGMSGDSVMGRDGLDRLTA